MEWFVKTKQSIWLLEFENLTKLLPSHEGDRKETSPPLRQFHTQGYTHPIAVVPVWVTLAKVPNRGFNLCLTLNIAMNKKYNSIKTKQKVRNLKWETELDYHMRYYRWKHFCTVSIFLDFWSNWKQKNILHFQKQNCNKQRT